MHAGLAIIKDEHRALAAVIHGLSYLVAELEKGKAKPDFPLFHAILDYIDRFPDTLHHPKEEDFLFSALRRRTNEGGEVLALLEADHRRQKAEREALQVALVDYEREGPGAFRAFAEQAKAMVESNFRHMAAEEGVLLPLAMRVLTDGDWAAIDAAFKANADPLTGAGAKAQGEMDALFDRIMTLAPAPLGLG
jgi:branched-chain amino acid transport system ATP-binding protein